jgi:sec-independent protein translocase protein TatA
MHLGLPEVLIIFGIGLLFFGPKRIPDIAKGLGQGIRDFKKALNGDKEDDETKKKIDGSRKE